ncbi:MAG: hypothetical protein HFJ09_02835 [Lachnospiraceae bacterium]|nr:hypothetical protein [Lachnospiraceae bacterium]
MYLIFFGKSCIKLYDRKLVTVYTYGVNSNRIQPIYNSPSAKGWILGYSMFLAHSLTASVKLVSEQ